MSDQMLAGDLLFIPVTDYAISLDVDMLLGRGEGFTWNRYILVRLPEEVDTGAVFPLQELDANIVCQHPGPPDSQVCVPHQCDGDPTLDVSAHPGLGLPPLCYEATGYPFQRNRRLHTQ